VTREEMFELHNGQVVIFLGQIVVARAGSGKVKENASQLQCRAFTLSGGSYLREAILFGIAYARLQRQ